MIAFAIRRILQTIPTLLIGSMIVWAILYVLPGDPAVLILGADASPEALAAVREELGLDQPLWIQYLAWLGRAVTGDLGVSYVGQVPVGGLLLERLGATVQLAVFAFLIALVVAIPLGSFAARYPRSIVAKLATAQSVLGLSIPSFWLGVLLVLVFAVNLSVFPAVSKYVPFFSDPAGALMNTALPAVTLGFYLAAVLGQFLREAITDMSRLEFVRTARSKGISENRVFTRHTFRNALLPFVTVLGLQVGTFLGGAVITETVFNYPGLGMLIYSAISQRDYPVVQAATLLIIVLVTLANLVVDLVYAALDPRIGLE